MQLQILKNVFHAERNIMNKKTYKKKPKECKMCGTVKEMTARGKWCSNRCKQENKNSKKKDTVVVNVTLLDGVKAFDDLLGINSLDGNIFQRVAPYKPKLK